MGQAQVALDHHGGVVGILGIILQHLGLGQGLRRPIHPVAAIHFLGDQLHPVAQFHLQRIEELEVVLFVAGVDHRIGKLERAVAAQFPMLGFGAPRPGCLGDPAHHPALLVGVGVEAVDADHRVDPGLADDIDQVHHVLATLLDQPDVLLGIGVIQGLARNHLRSAAVHLQGTDGGGKHGDVRLQAGVAAFHVPELLEADIGSEAGLGDVVFKELQGHPVGNDRRLADGDIGKGSGVDQTGVVLGGTHQGRIDGVAHEGGHGVAHFQVTAGHRFAALVEGHGDVVDPFLQVGQVGGDGQDGHQLGADGDAELGLHGVAVGTTAEADDDITEGLGTEVDNPAEFHPGGVDVQPAHTGQPGQLLVVIVALMLHPGGHGDHPQVVGVHDVVDIAGEAEGKLGHRDQQGVAAARRGALDVHGRATGRLTQGTASQLTALAQTFHQAAGGGGLAFAQRGRGNRGHLDVLAVRLVFETIDDLQEIELGQAAHGQDFVFLQAQSVAPLLGGGHVFFGSLGNLPVLHIHCIKSHFILLR